MKEKIGFLIIVFMVVFNNMNAQETATNSDTELLGLLGDNLDLYASLDLFQKSKTIEEFEASLNDEKTGINNLDLNLDGNVDFVKVITQQDGNDFTFVLQVDVSEKEIQDVAVILVSKDSEGKISVQMVGDEALYGADYVIEPKPETPSVTANPAYSGNDTIVVQSQASTVVVLESEPVIVYVYSPSYIHYYPPYYYGYYPYYYRPYPVVSINIYVGRHRHYHNYYHGGHRGGNTVVINNNNTFNNYSRTRNTSNTVNVNKKAGLYQQNNVFKSPANKTIPNTKRQDSKFKGKKNFTKSKNSAFLNQPSNFPVNMSKQPTSKPSARLKN